MRVPIEQLLKSPESKTLEFKRDLSSPQNMLKTIIAFANSAGGTLMIGVADKNQKIVGVANPLNEEERLCNLISDSIEPRLVPNIEVISHKKKTMLAAEVYPSGTRPHWLKAEGPLEGVYVRLGSTNRKADRALVEELKRSSSGTSFDEMPMPTLKKDALDIRKARELFKGIRLLKEKDLLTLKLLTKEQGGLVPTVGGMLLFGIDRELHFADAWVQCARFEGTTKSTILDHIEIHEHLPLAVEQAIAFVRKHSMRGADLSNIRRRDVWNIPPAIAREAIINAVVHADYSQQGAPIRVAIYDDRVEIENPGILLPGLTLEDVFQGISKLRNKVIGRVFRELGLIEQWGSGIRRIFNEVRRLGLPEPSIEEIGMRLRFTLYLTPRKMQRAKDSNGTADQVSDQVAGVGTGEVAGVGIGEVAGAGTPQVTPQGTPQVAPQVTPQVRRLIACIDGAMNRNELMKALELIDRMHFSREYLYPALQAGLVEMTIPEKPNSPKQQYRLTEAGRNLAKHISKEVKQ
ncbi:MAG: Divergent AAA domain protein [Candidatus Hydrogenedentes bacterium ADurb.Bin101]|nr:MAG: Divergent AAA domain protein [Candidatus Hydrogenedentes bacterium ADurb.Bin101]HOC69770.1 helix-turn-helix domain-containing protein [Candidatus Hydrogenedentota bacterium]